VSNAELTFAEQFAAGWATPTAERLVTLLTDDVVLFQPHLPPLRGKAAALAEFRRLFRWLPRLHGEVHRARGSDGVVYIEWTMRFPFGRAVVDIPAVDRFFLRDGLGAERTVYFDQLPLMAGVLRHPSEWPGYLRYRFAR
jgi:hypothetical protein